MIENLSRDTEITKTNPMGMLALKNKIYKRQYSPVGLNSKIKMKEESQST